MSSLQDLKKRACEAIDKRADELIKVGREIYSYAELGFKEHKTSALVEEKFKDMGLKYEKQLAITGIRAELKGKKSDIRVGIMGEMDAVICFEHPNANQENGAVHACGHNAQVVNMLGVGYGLLDSGVINELDGDVALMGVPAEEYVEIEYRNNLRKAGKLEFLGGKQEFIRLGVLDDIDMTMLIHTSSNRPQRAVTGGGTSNGFIGKTMRYMGKSAHAGGAPHKGVNALDAAMLGLMGVNALRTTFKDEDAIRVHPIITRGGDLVNVIPADVRAETYIRGKRMEAIVEANEKVNCALRAGAMAMGAEVEIDEIPGYMPLNNHIEMHELFEENARQFIGEENIVRTGHGAGSTDMGDVTCIMPGNHPNVGGIAGSGHAKDHEIVDEEMVYVVAAKIMAMTVIDLLHNGAEKAKQIKEEYDAPMTKETYLDTWRQFFNGEK